MTTLQTRLPPQPLRNQMEGDDVADGGIHILLVENDAGTRKLLRDGLESLSSLPLYIDEAADGREGLEAIRTRGPDLVLLDLVMPRMSGLGLLLALREDPPERVPQIVVLSRVSSETVIERVLDLGVDFFFQKPVELGELTAVIQALCLPRPVREPLRRSRVWRLLEELGAPEHRVGSRWMALTAQTLAYGPEGMLLKEAYFPAIQQSRSSYSTVDKNIRDVIQVIHHTAAPAYQKLMGGIPSRCPSSGVFLGRLAQELRDGRQEK